MELNLPRQRTLAVLLAFLIGSGAALRAAAEETHYAAALQNHVFAGSKQDGYTNGLFFTQVRTASAGADGVEPTALLKPVLGWLGVSRSTLAAASLRQIMITPRELERSVPAPTDTPYAGALVFRSTHVKVQGETADMLALDLGVTGPASGAEKVQRWIHNTNDATKPQGWDTQGPTRVLVGIEGYRAWRSPLGGSAGAANADFVALAGGVLGNRESWLGGTLLLRYGTDLAGSFPSLARVSGRTSDPFIRGDGWFAFAGLSADRRLGDRGLGSDARNHSIELRKSQVFPMLGIAYGWGNASLTFSLHGGTPLIESVENRQNYGSITYTWRGD